jgi:NADPH-dependent 2,4-dienoyl-CoA reductase/sulfur reductase-like enzyme
MKKTKIVIAGGGFAGLYAAKYLDEHMARRPDVEVTLIARENFILFTPMLHEVAAGDLAPGDIVNPLRRILRHINVIAADVRDVDLSARKVRCLHGFEGTELEFDFDHLRRCKATLPRAITRLNRHRRNDRRIGNCDLPDSGHVLCNRKVCGPKEVCAPAAIASSRVSSAARNGGTSIGFGYLRVALSLARNPANPRPRQRTDFSSSVRCADGISKSPLNSLL